MGRPHGKDGCRRTSEENEEKGEKTSRMQEKGNEQLRSKDCMRWDMRRSGEDERWRGGSDKKVWKEKKKE